jgi:Rnl2 family RNA ligase
MPSKKDLPMIPNNFCEGIVIKPIQPLFLGNGSRVILKNKNEEFCENHGGNSVKEVKPKKEISAVVQKLMKEGTKYINDNRLRAVISKIGEIGEKDFGKLNGLFIKDVVEDLRKDFEEFNSLSNDDRSDLTKFLNKEASTFIRPNFLNIIDGSY